MSPSRRFANPATAIASAAGTTLVVLGLAYAPARAQSQPDIETLDARLARVERVLDQSLLGQLQRIDGLERELRVLRGELEELNNEIETQKRRGGDLYADTDRRVTDLDEAQEAAEALYREVGLDGLSVVAGEDGGPDGAGGTDDGGGLDLTGVSAQGSGSDVAGSPGRFVGTRQAPDGEQLQPIEVRTSATQAEKTAYTRAYDLLARGDNDAAVAEFDAFIEEYPDGPYSFNAWYWKGEARYAERDFDSAIENFSVVTDRFPTSTKVPDARLKIGFSLYEQGDFASARGILESVRDEFQGRSAAVLARKRLQKMDREGV